MPGLKKSPGMADIDVCYGAHRSGKEGVQSAFQKARWAYEQAPLQKLGTLDLNRYSEIISSPEEEPDSEATVEDVSPVSPEIHERFDNNVSPAPESIPLESFDPEESRLPPTPPTMNNSDDAEQKRDENLNPPPLFVDDVKYALSSKQSGQNMTPVNQPASPPTPDPSPPRKQQSPPRPDIEQKERPQFLYPTTNNALREGASSRAESFRTAEEDQPFGPNITTSPVHLPENDTLPKHWLDTTRELQSATIGLGDVTVAQTPIVGNSAAPQNMTPETWRFENPRNASSSPGNMENAHIGRQDAEERNNFVYRRLREENVKRHSTVSANSGAITVGITLPSNESTPKTLRRQNKRSSLRVSTTGDIGREMSHTVDGSHTVTNGEMNGIRGLGIDGGRTLKQRKARELDKTSILTESPLFGRSALDDSPVLGYNIRQVSSPARLGPDASDMTALTYASMQESPSAKRVSKFQSDPPHKLRHFSYEDRLSRNMSVRRTSLEASPEMNSATFPPQLEVERTRPQLSNDENKVKKNIAVKRSQVPDTKTPQRAAPPLTSSPNVAASPGASPYERSPGGTLRHFSREERLENNASVRRTSLDRTSQSTPQTEPTARHGSFDKGVATTSPRKSMDARYLYPITTPMSVSQFSDRTENIEIGEANGVRLYPHTNESLLVVQQGSRPNSNDRDASEAPHFFPSTLARPYVAKPSFTAHVEPPTPTLSSSRPAHQVDSPLTNPRTAPEPPIFKVIPPTPERELDQQLDNQPLGSVTTTIKANNPPRRRLSLVQRARRYSDIMFPNLGSLRISRDRRYPEERDTYLSPLWKPQGFWDEQDSDDYDDFEPSGTLPRGGDTSDIGENEAQKRGLLPRAMSKRLPGFRGTGGFLQGNSLGIDRHGTNNRRHYVSTSTRTLSKRQSEEVIKNLSSTAGRMSPEQRVMRPRYLVLPFTTKKFRAKMRAIRLAKEEREREKRRERLRRSIGYRVYHDS